MRRFTSGNFAQRERDAFLVATASDAEILDMCERLGYDPQDMAQHTRRLLLETCETPSSLPNADAAASMLQLPTPGLLPLHRILLVDDNAARLGARLAEFRLHQFSLGFVIKSATSAEEAIARLESERFEAVLIELASPTETLERLRSWSTPLAPIVLNSSGMEILDLRKLNRDAIRALAVAFGKPVPPPYRKKAAGRATAKKPCQSALFDSSNGKKTGSS
jgi:CheY-like chemotaxis protein